MSLTNFRSILINASCVVGTRNILLIHLYLRTNFVRTRCTTVLCVSEPCLADSELAEELTTLLLSMAFCVRLLSVLFLLVLYTGRLFNSSVIALPAGLLQQ